MDLETLLVYLFVLVDDWWEELRPASSPRPGRPVSLSEAEGLTLAVLAQWPRFRSERDFWRFADAHLRAYFPNLLSHGQLNRRVRALEPELRALQRHLAQALAKDSAASAFANDAAKYIHVISAGLEPMIERTSLGLRLWRSKKS